MRSSCIQISTSPEFCGSYVCREAKGNVMMTSAAFVFNQVDVHLYLKFRTQIVILKEHTIYTTGRILIFHCIVFHKTVCASVSVSVCRCGFRILPGGGGQFLRPEAANIVKQSHVSEVSWLRFGSRALEAFGFLVLECAFSHILETLSLSFSPSSST